MTHTLFFLLVVQIKFVTLFVALSLSFFLPHWKKKKKKKKKKKRERPGPLYYTKVRAIVVVVVLRRRKEWSSSSSSSSKRERRQNHRFSFGADSLREFQFKWPTTRRRRPNKSRRRLMVVVRLRGLHKHPTPRNKTKTLYYPWWRKSQRWTGPCTRPASCPFYSAFTSTLVPMMRSESRWSLEFAFELVAVFLLFFIRREEDKNCCPILTLICALILSLSYYYYYYYYYEFDHPQQRRNHHHRNIVATVNLDCKLDLKTIAFHARNVEYNPKVRRRRRARRAIHLFSFCVFLLSCGRRERKERTSRWNGTLTYLYAL